MHNHNKDSKIKEVKMKNIKIWLIVVFISILISAFMFLVSAEDIIIKSGSLFQPVYSSDDNLVLNMPFSEGTGTTTYDKSPYGNDGTITGATWTTGKYGNALSFDGINDYVGSGTNIGAMSFQRTDPFSVSLWVKAGLYTSNAGIVQHQDGTNFDGWYLGTNSAGMPSMTLATSGTDKYSVNPTSAALPIGEWMHVVYTYDGSSDGSGFKLYEDGNAISLSVIDNDCGATIAYSSAALEIGRRKFSSIEFNGTIDEVRIYNRAVSEDEIRIQYLQGLQSHGYITTDKFRIINTSVRSIFEVNNSGMVLTNGRVGIGTASPQEHLHVYGSGTQRLEVESSDTSVV